MLRVTEHEMNSGIKHSFKVNKIEHDRIISNGEVHPITKVSMLQTLRLKYHKVILKHQKEVETQAKRKCSAKQH